MDRPDVIFFGTYHYEVVFWARQLGYRKSEVQIVTDPNGLRGVGADATIYLAGRWWHHPQIEEAVLYLRSVGVNVIEAANALAGDAA